MLIGGLKKKRANHTTIKKDVENEFTLDDELNLNIQNQKPIIQLESGFENLEGSLDINLKLLQRKRNNDVTNNTIILDHFDNSELEKLGHNDEEQDDKAKIKQVGSAFNLNELQYHYNKNSFESKFNANIDKENSPENIEVQEEKSSLLSEEDEEILNWENNMLKSNYIPIPKQKLEQKPSNISDDSSSRFNFKSQNFFLQIGLSDGETTPNKFESIKLKIEDGRKFLNQQNLNYKELINETNSLIKHYKHLCKVYKECDDYIKDNRNSPKEIQLDCLNN